MTSLSSKLTAALSRVQKRGVRNSDRVTYGRHELRVGEIRALEALSTVRQAFSFVVAKSGMDKAQMSRTIKELSRKGMVSAIEMPNTTSGINARLLVRLTAHGVNARAEVLRRIADADRQMMSGLTATERRMLPKILEKLAA